MTAQHVNERISQQMVVSGIVIGSAAAAGSSDSDWAVAVPILVGAAGTGYLLSFNRQQESEADEQGLKYMTAAGYDPQAMIEVLEVLRAAASGPRPPEFLATHPYPETRIKLVSKLLAGTYAYTQNNPDYGKYPDRYRDDALRYLPETENQPEEATAALSASTWCGVCRARLDTASESPKTALTTRQPRS
jgi:predicted Zn-dependent protease